MAAKAGRYDENLLRNVDGVVRAVTSADVYVYQSDGVTLATLYADRDKTAGSNPVSPDAAGNLEFFADPGIYVLKIYVDGTLRRTDTINVPIDGVEAGSLASVASNETVTGSWDFTGGIKENGAELKSTYVPARVADAAGFGDDATDATAHLQAKLDAGDTYLPAGTFRISAALTISVAGRRLWGPGTIKRMFNGPMVQVSAAEVVIEGVKLDGNNSPGGFTGTGIQASTAADLLVHDVKIDNTGGTCVEFTTAGASLRAKIAHSFLQSGGGAVAVKFPATSESAGSRHLIDISTGGTALADFGGCDVTTVVGCNALTIGTFTTTSKKVGITGCRFGSGGFSDTVLGSGHSIVGNIIGGDLIIDADSTNNTVVGNVLAGALTNNSGANSTVVGNTDSSGRDRYVDVTGGAFTGAVLFTPGTAAAPGIAFSGDPGTGGYHQAASVLAWALGGTRHLALSSTVLTPATNGLKALGGSSERWSTAYANSLNIGSGSGVSISTGTGTPEGAVTAPVGSLYTRDDGGAGTTLYVKESGVGNTGWVAK